MATPQERFAAALRVLKDLQDRNEVAITGEDLPNRIYREILLKNGFIKEVVRGWYVSSDPNAGPGETTSWYSSYWDFCLKFLNSRYGNDWILSADQSLKIHAGNWSVPSQLFLRSPKGNNNPTSLAHNTSLFNYRANLPVPELTTIERGIRMYSLQGALLYCSTASFSGNGLDARTALSLIRDASELLPVLLENGHSVIAGRLGGAFRNIGRERIADQIIETMRQAGYDVREDDPFQAKITIDLSLRERSPFVNRIKLMWQQMRDVVIRNFPVPPGLPKDHKAYLENVDSIYITDAYHSLSIERYKVTPELIERVSLGSWNTKGNAEDRKQQDAMAARGYFQTFQIVKESVKNILDGKNPGDQVDQDHPRWYRELFDPSVAAGILKASDLAGYRSNQVYISNSQHVPLSVDAMRDCMSVLFELLEGEPEASVRAVLGHFVFVFIHPYMDGNGRMGRFLMNAMLASGGYPWTVIPVEKRKEYMKVLEHASIEQNISEFSKFLAYLVNEGLKGKPVAVLPQ
ncbi:cell filamentation protein Fic [Pedobacter psychrodurus]|uniref:Cell filamentation protein Fic n=1 Tax=Pedobacter psychrodurus TaxID=2530456 RepID=A0A4R0Q6G9_9SPHI|nr:Fic family protein [Pedobacter psychrodurus]TCD28779.1 cell filamentation protein Fic [Pedobacter psychrodurus]